MKHLAERKKIYSQGKSHRNFNLRPYYKQHKFYSDYMDGYHGRPFRKRLQDPTPVAKLFLWLAALFGA